MLEDTKVHTRSILVEFQHTWNKKIPQKLPYVTYVHVLYHNLTWLVVGPPLWKIWVRQLGWWQSQYMGKFQKWQPNHQPATDVTSPKISHTARTVESLNLGHETSRTCSARHRIYVLTSLSLSSSQVHNCHLGVYRSTPLMGQNTISLVCGWRLVKAVWSKIESRVASMVKIRLEHWCWPIQEWAHELCPWIVSGE